MNVNDFTPTKTTTPADGHNAYLGDGRWCPSNASAAAATTSSKPGPHVVTPELAAVGTKHLAEASAAADRAIVLQRASDELRTLAESAWAESASKRHLAESVLLGPNRGYAGY